MPLAPRSAMPIPVNASLPCSTPAGHFLVLFSTVLPFTSKSPTGWDGKASKNMPAREPPLGVLRAGQDREEVAQVPDRGPQIHPACVLRNPFGYGFFAFR